jgi:hypothetical protein
MAGDHHRNQSDSNVPALNLGLGARKTTNEGHPAGVQKHGSLMQIWRAVTFVAYFFTCVFA